MSDDDQNIAEEGAEAVRDYTEDLESALSRPGENRVKRWVLIEGRRIVVTLALLCAVFLLLLGGSLIRPVQLRDLLTETDTVKTLFNTLLSGVILLVSVVVSINSIVLSQEIGDIEAQEERTSASLEFRRRIEESIESDVTPARPGEFVRVVLYTILHKTNELQGVAADTANDEFQQQVEDLGEKISNDVERARNILGEAKYGTFRVLLAGLNYDYAGQLHAVRYLKRSHGADLTDEEVDALDDLVDSLVFFTTGREYFKSLYYKRELAQLSSRLLYVSLPVIVFISYVLLAVDAKRFPDTWVLGLPPLFLFISLAYSIALAPYVVLTSYVLRASTVSLRTLAAGPFILRRGDDVDAVDLEDYDEEIEWESEMASDG
ncbi:hypothetical protein OB920_00765 [Halobacteria archaeon HArc-gm2]|nr:hypothetical protein [Halobacteria archaeon HArc-gm2]